MSAKEEEQLKMQQLAQAHSLSCHLCSGAVKYCCIEHKQQDSVFHSSYCVQLKELAAVSIESGATQEDGMSTSAWLNEYKTRISGILSEHQKNLQEREHIVWNLKNWANMHLEKDAEAMQKESLSYTKLEKLKIDGQMERLSTLLKNAEMNKHRYVSLAREFSYAPDRRPHIYTEHPHKAPIGDHAHPSSSTTSAVPPASSSSLSSTNTSNVNTPRGTTASSKIHEYAASLITTKQLNDQQKKKQLHEKIAMGEAEDGVAEFISAEEPEKHVNIKPVRKSNQKYAISLLNNNLSD